MKYKKSVAVLLAGLVGVGSCFSVSPKAKAVDTADICSEIVAGALIVGVIGGVIV